MTPMQVAKEALENVCRAFDDLDRKVIVKWPDPVTQKVAFRRASRAWDEMCDSYDQAKTALARIAELEAQANDKPAHRLCPKCRGNTVVRLLNIAGNPCGTKVCDTCDGRGEVPTYAQPPASEPAKCETCDDRQEIGHYVGGDEPGFVEQSCPDCVAEMEAPACGPVVCLERRFAVRAALREERICNAPTPTFDEDPCPTCKGTGQANGDER
jgi:hypothetical protein